MKTIRNNLWLMIIAWTMVIETKMTLGIIIGVIASIYLFYNNKSINYRSTVILIMLLFSVNTSLLISTFLKPSFLLLIFALIISINISLIYQYSTKIRLKSLYIIMTIMIISYLLMFISIYIFPFTIMNISAKINAIYLLSVVFIPYSFIILIMLIQKEYRLKKLQSYYKTLENKSMYNIKA